MKFLAFYAKEMAKGTITTKHSIPTVTYGGGSIMSGYFSSAGTEKVKTFSGAKKYLRSLIVQVVLVKKKVCYFHVRYTLTLIDRM